MLYLISGICLVFVYKSKKLLKKTTILLIYSEFFNLLNSYIIIAEGSDGNAACRHGHRFDKLQDRDL